MAGWKEKSSGNIGNYVGEIESTGEEASETLRDVDAEKEAPDVIVEPTTRLMPTLPRTFKSLVGRPISAADKEPRNIIASLGRCLGVEDYETNMASFWFLDFVALQVLQSEGVLDDRGRSVMVSWLAGEMQLIREERLSHDEFWRRIRDIFASSAKNVSRGRKLPHWDSTAEESSAEALFVEEKAPEGSKEAETTPPKFAGPRATSKSHRRRIPGKESSRQSAKSSGRMAEPDSIKDERSIIRPEIQHRKVLDAVVEATRAMYGDTFHYALIVAAFLDPVPMRDYTLPIEFRVPRPFKTYDAKSSAADQDSSRARKSNETSKKTNGKKPKKIRDTKAKDVGKELVASIVATGEEVSMKKRQYILPLMEANEASGILAKYKESRTK